MTNKNVKNSSIAGRNNSHSRPGIILLVTLVLLVVLSILGYTLSSQVLAQRHRNQYIIDYSKARYGCDSAVKYALTTLEEIDPQLISRPNEPDFSDLFALDEAGYQELLSEWNINSMTYMSDNDQGLDNKNNSNNVNDFSNTGSNNGLDLMLIRGPYGPAWPFVTEPEEFEIGSVKVRIEIEDENSKYPLGWALLNDPEMQIEIDAGFMTLCEMVGLDAEQIDSLRLELSKIAEIKPFKLDFKPITKVIRTPTKPASTVRKSTTRRRTTTPKVQRKVITVPIQVFEQTSHFAQLFHSSLIDTESLARPNIMTGSRKEPALKYMGTWGTRKVNINTAPRHVLEAAFIFGGNQVEIAEEIIQRRRMMPFTDTVDLKNAVAGYSDSLTKCEPYITTKSTFYTIKITAVSGVAKASSVIAITKNGSNITRIAIING